MRGNVLLSISGLVETSDTISITMDPFILNVLTFKFGSPLRVIQHKTFLMKEVQPENINIGCTFNGNHNESLQ